MLSFSTEKQSPADPAEVDRNAYNAAFYELGLKWHWDVETYQSLPTAEEAERLRHYLSSHQSHLLNAYDSEFLVNAIQATKARCHANLAARAADDAPAVNWEELHRPEVGV